MNLDYTILLRNFSKKFIPEIKLEDVIPNYAGVRAQALMNDGFLVNDFLMINNSSHQVKIMVASREILFFYFEGLG